MKRSCLISFVYRINVFLSVLKRLFEIHFGCFRARLVNMNSMDVWHFALLCLPVMHFQRRARLSQDRQDYFVRFLQP